MYTTFGPIKVCLFICLKKKREGRRGKGNGEKGRREEGEGKKEGKYLV